MAGLRSGERGQGIVEFAVIFPIFILFVFVAIDGGLLMGRYNDVNHAAKEGARLAATGATTTDVVKRVKAQAQGALDNAPNVSTCSGAEYICVTYSDAPDPDRNDAGEVGSTVMVVVRYKYDPITPLTGTSILGLPISGLPDLYVVACSASRLEQPFPGVSNAGDNEC